MQDKHVIRLGSTDSVRSVNKDNWVDVNLQQTTKPYFFTPNIKGVIDQYEQFELERQNCTSYRVITTIKPYCTNALFNLFTEIVNNGDLRDETLKIIDDVNIKGDFSGDVVYGKIKPTRIDMIRNTEYSRGDVDGLNYTYYPGLDFFNNHNLRNMTFKTVNSPNNNNDREVFNTVKDYLRDCNGERVISNNRSVDINDVFNYNNGPKHLYDKEDVLDFIDSINTNLTEENGWFGFVNASSIISKDKQKNEEGFNLAINNREPCEFVDMYPDRTLFSFSPKYNPVTNKTEDNWDFCFTYPYENFYDHELITDINGEDPKNPEKLNALLLANTFVQTAKDGSQILMFQSYVKHNVTVGQHINIYYKFPGENVYTRKEVYISNIADLESENSDYYFYTADLDILEDINMKINDLNSGINPIINVNFGDLLSKMPEDDQARFNELVSDESNNKKILQIILGDDYSEDSSYVGNEYESKNFEINLCDYELTYCSKTDGSGNDIYKIVTFEIDSNGQIVMPTDDKSEDDEDKEDEKGEQYERLIIRIPYISLYNEHILSKITFRFNKLINECETEYYIRRHRKLPNFMPSNKNGRYLNMTLEDNICTNVFEDKTKPETTNFNFTDNKYRLAFSNTIYGDENTQITFTDTINVDNLLDNRGRPLTEIYLTILKRNKGNKEWYKENKKYEEIEYSHCFSELSCGFDLFMSEDDKINGKGSGMFSKHTKLSNIRLINQCDWDNNIGWNSLDEDKKKEGCDIDIDDTYFFGDIVEYVPVFATENILAKCNYRFNTYQREHYTKFLDDDKKEEGEKQFIKYNFFIDDIASDDQDVDEFQLTDTESTTEEFFSHKEGYYYIPHYKIPLKEFGELKQSTHYGLRVKSCELKLIDKQVFAVITTTLPHNLSPTEKIIIRDRYRNKQIAVVVSYVLGRTTFAIGSIGGLTTQNICDVLNGKFIELSGNQVIEKNSIIFDLYKFNPDIPFYAERMPTDNRYLWREVRNVGDINNVSLPEYSFGNGHFYVNQEINFYLKRQDPFDEYDMYYSGGEVYNYIPNDVFGKYQPRSAEEYKDETLVLC